MNKIEELQANIDRLQKELDKLKAENKDYEKMFLDKSYNRHDFKRYTEEELFGVELHGSSITADKDEHTFLLVRRLVKMVFEDINKERRFIDNTENHYPFFNHYREIIDVDDCCRFQKHEPWFYFATEEDCQKAIDITSNIFGKNFLMYYLTGRWE